MSFIRWKKPRPAPDSPVGKIWWNSNISDDPHELHLFSFWFRSSYILFFVHSWPWPVVIISFPDKRFHACAGITFFSLLRYLKQKQLNVYHKYDHPDLSRLPQKHTSSSCSQYHQHVLQVAGIVRAFVDQFVHKISFEHEFRVAHLAFHFLTALSLVTTLSHFQHSCIPLPLYIIFVPHLEHFISHHALFLFT